MLKATKIVNRFCIVFGLFGIAWLYKYNPNLVQFWSFLPILPYAMTLLALRAHTKAIGRWAALAMNVINFFVYIFLFGLSAAGEVHNPVIVASYALLYGLVPCGLNSWVLYTLCRSKWASSQHNGTRADKPRTG